MSLIGRLFGRANGHAVVPPSVAIPRGRPRLEDAHRVKARNADILQRYASERAVDIARAHGISVKRVYQIVYQHRDARTKAPRPPVSPARNAAIIEKYQSGSTGGQLADEYGVTRATIYNVLERAGIARRPPGHNAGPGFLWPEGRAAELRRLWLGGASAQQIVDIFGPPYTRNAIIGKVNRLRKEGMLRVDPPAAAQ